MGWRNGRALQRRFRVSRLERADRRIVAREAFVPAAAEARRRRCRSECRRSPARHSTRRARSSHDSMTRSKAGSATEVQHGPGIDQQCVRAGARRRQFEHARLAESSAPRRGTPTRRATLGIEHDAVSGCRAVERDLMSVVAVTAAVFVEHFLAGRVAGRCRFRGVVEGVAAAGRLTASTNGDRPAGSRRAALRRRPPGQRWQFLNAQDEVDAVRGQARVDIIT